MNSSKILKRLMQLEKQKTEHEERISSTLSSIAACMKRQEEATQKLTRVLLQLIPRVLFFYHHLTGYSSLVYWLSIEIVILFQIYNNNIS